MLDAGDSDRKRKSRDLPGRENKLSKSRELEMFHFLLARE